MFLLIWLPGKLFVVFMLYFYQYMGMFVPYEFTTNKQKLIDKCAKELRIFVKMNSEWSHWLHCNQRFLSIKNRLFIRIVFYLYFFIIIFVWHIERLQCGKFFYLIRIQCFTNLYILKLEVILTIYYVISIFRCF